MTERTAFALVPLKHNIIEFNTDRIRRRDQQRVRTLPEISLKIKDFFYELLFVVVN